MTTSLTAKLRKRAERAEGMALGMGFLLLKLRAQYGNDFGYGMAEQVDQAIADYRSLAAAMAQRGNAPIAQQGGSA
ncbi:hypothetical protein [Xylophilus sp. GOD-11R]|uniref:hypothetical protein n=1 Tax=Xylophilus sp. GOD-11R TaxID=3089814 RepID=UPI00298C9D0E|nr:hypothetical protein [Xylophilus sp. GOD-11R]WPB58608.1 hypothetical protein R9X41_08230 [Xylophilus sp. GOD-11R]